MIVQTCKFPGCGRPATTNGYCQLHQDEHKTISQQRLVDPYEHAKMHFYNTKKWIELRNRLKFNHPWCSLCEKETGLKLMVNRRKLVADHIVPWEVILNKYIERHGMQQPTSYNDWLELIETPELNRKLMNEDNIQIICMQHHWIKHHGGHTIKNKTNKHNYR